MNPLFTLQTLLLLINSSLAFYRGGSIMTDLTSLVLSEFQADAASWTLSATGCSSCNKIYTTPPNSCGIGQEVIFGGPGILGPSGGSTSGQHYRRSYTSLASQYTPSALEFDLWTFYNSIPSDPLTINFYEIDADSGDSVIQSTYVTLINSCTSLNYVDSQGNTIKAFYKFHVLILMDHHWVATLDMKFLSLFTVPSSVSSFGFRNFQYYLDGSIITSSTISPANFPCMSGQLWNGAACVYCPSSCKTCADTSSGLCTSCKNGYYDYGNGTCLSTCKGPFTGITTNGFPYLCQLKCNPSTEFYWFHNQSCSGRCDNPLSSSVDGNNAQICSNLCYYNDASLSYVNKFLYPDRTCISTCEAPLEIKTPNICQTPCENSNDYVFRNGSCTSQCSSPLIGTQVNGIFYCNSPCPNEYIFAVGGCNTECPTPLVSIEDSADIKYCINPCAVSDTFLYPNVTCQAACPSPLFNEIKPEAKYCINPCSQNDTFLYNNESCQSTCPSPNIPRTESIGKFCKFPCKNTEHYYSTIDGSCQSTCPYPYQATETPLPKICSSTLSEEEIKQIKQLAGATDTTNTVSGGSILIGTILSSSDSTSVCMGPFSKMLSYVKYMNIVYSEKVQLMMLQQSSEGAGFANKFMGDVLDKFPDHELPERFELYKAKSSFFVNFWSALFNLLVLFLIAIVVILVKPCVGTSGKMREIFLQIEETFRWNVVLVIFCGNFGDIVLFTALELQTMRFDSASAGVSFGVCILMNILCILVVVKILDVNLAVRKSKQQDFKQEGEIQKDWCSYKAVFQCYRDQTYFQQIFLFVFIMRVSIFNAIIGYLYLYPLLQIILITLANLFILSYLIFKRPIKQLVNLFQQIVLEVVLLPFNVCVLVLAVLDARGIEAFHERKTIGDVMVYINVVIPVLSVVLIAIKFVVLGYQLYKEWRLSKKGATSGDGLKRVQRIGELSISNRIHHPIRPSNQSMNMNYLQPPSANNGIKLPSSPIMTNQMHTLDITTQNLDLSTSQETSFAFMNHSINSNSLNQHRYQSSLSQDHSQSNQHNGNRGQRRRLDSSMSLMHEHEQPSFISQPSPQLSHHHRPGRLRLRSRDMEEYNHPEMIANSPQLHHQKSPERRIARRKNKTPKQNQPRGNIKLRN